MKDCFIKTENGWNHRPLFKVIINKILRKIQWLSNKPFVIVSECEMANDIPKLIRYRFLRYPIDNTKL